MLETTLPATSWEKKPADKTRQDLFPSTHFFQELGLSNGTFLKETYCDNCNPIESRVGVANNFHIPYDGQEIPWVNNSMKMI